MAHSDGFRGSETGYKKKRFQEQNNVRTGTSWEHGPAPGHVYLGIYLFMGKNYM